MSFCTPKGTNLAHYFWQRSELQIAMTHVLYVNFWPRLYQKSENQSVDAGLSISRRGMQHHQAEFSYFLWYHWCFNIRPKIISTVLRWSERSGAEAISHDAEGKRLAPRKRIFDLLPCELYNIQIVKDTLWYNWPCLRPWERRSEVGLKKKKKKKFHWSDEHHSCCFCLQVTKRQRKTRNTPHLLQSTYCSWYCLAVLDVQKQNKTTDLHWFHGPWSNHGNVPTSVQWRKINQQIINKDCLSAKKKSFQRQMEGQSLKMKESRNLNAWICIFFFTSFVNLF